MRGESRARLPRYSRIRESRGCWEGGELEYARVSVNFISPDENPSAFPLGEISITGGAAAAGCWRFGWMEVSEGESPVARVRASSRLSSRSGKRGKTVRRRSSPPPVQPHRARSTICHVAPTKLRSIFPLCRCRQSPSPYTARRRASEVLRNSLS